MGSKVIAAFIAALFLLLTSIELSESDRQPISPNEEEQLNSNECEELDVYAATIEIEDEVVPTGSIVIMPEYEPEAIVEDAPMALSESIQVEHVSEASALEMPIVEHPTQEESTQEESTQEESIQEESIQEESTPIESTPEELTTIEQAPEEPTPVVEEIDYEALEVARYIMSWQLPSGGWTKNQKAIYQRYWNGSEAIAKYYQSDGVTPLGTIDNDATVNELRYLAKVYQNSKDIDVKASIHKGINFLLAMQYDSGGFPQVYPVQDHACSNYENMATYNDDAMTNVMWLFQDILYERNHFGGDLIGSDQRSGIQKAYDKGIDYILKSQIVVNGQLTGWCAQHDPVTFEPVRGRAFEPVSISGQESVSVARFLESIAHKNSEAKASLNAFVKWLDTVAIEDMRYDRYTKTDHYFDYSKGDYMWYRFYEIGTNKGLFADADGVIYYDFLGVSEERRTNYGYAGDWGEYFIQ